VPSSASKTRPSITVEHDGALRLDRHHDAGRLPATDQRERRRQARQWRPAGIDGLGDEAQSARGQQEGGGIERAVRQGGDIAQFGLAHRPAELAQDVEQRPHQAVGRAAMRRIDDGDGGFEGGHRLLGGV
jgi:hypothetical protein